MNTSEIFNSLKVNSGYIYVLYRKLYYLEYNNKKDSEEYNNILNTICKLKKIEDELIKYASSISIDDAFGLCSLAQADMIGNKISDRLIHDTSYILSNKIHEKDIVDMRISYKETKNIVNILNDKIGSNVHNIYMPLRDKYFIDILDKEIIECDEHKKILLDAKYDYAFINSSEGVKTIDEFTAKEIDEYINFSILELSKIAVRLSKYNKNTLLCSENRRRFLLDLSNIRANSINLCDEDILELKLYLLFEKKCKRNDGFNFFINALELRNEDYDEINKNFSLKRMF